MRLIRLSAFAILLGHALVALAAGEAAAEEPGQGWAHYGGDAGGSRFSAATQITPQNVTDLEPAWVFDSGDMERRPEAVARSASEGTPILAGGALTYCTPFNEIISLDPGTGDIRWRHDAEIETDYNPANQFVCRGVTYWADPSAEDGTACVARIFMGTADSRLIAVDAATGTPCAGFGNAGTVTIDPGMALLWRGEFQITSPPVVIGDTVVVGSAISDGARADAPKGSVRAFDARSGAPRWEFDPVARGAAEQPGSWRAEDAARTGHANVWAPMSVDEARGLVFLPTSSPSPDFYGGARPGDNRYANSVVALDGATGAVRWHFQTVHHDVWDYDLPAQPSLVTLQYAGGSRDVVVQVAKTGFVFVLDRDTGAPVFPVDEVPVPQDGAPGEWLSPTQPMPQKPPALVPHSITPDDAWGLTFLDRGACADLFAKYRNDGLFTPPSEQGTLMFPFSGGGANWGGMAFNPASQLMYVNTSRAVHLVKLIPREGFAAAKAAEPGKEISPQAGTAYGMKRDLMLSPLSLPCNKPPFGVLHAIDLSTGEIAWEATLGTVRDLAPVPIPWKLGTPNFGGPLVTASGLVFIGAAMDDYLRAFDAASGAELWKGRLPGGGQATPMTYKWQGRQYVVISAGGHSRSTATLNDRIVAFALPE
ncbi:PQQ-binding-like beta-propeller repeat protein [Pyruvatibacter mobilis]|uniref:PQQ-binding-like beta-propeller repeat protein n=1 Tax=Pyruvatibacter mobilis TaxID=1712261 RepID=A0A845QCW7_9HYPH|nr:pyrroloquinoline quinone-dependent dehydrogenase [Pyruvatibacter mobilis]NBG96432.1 PQQ-binding-like beta-propeller repeat protein [Pyruvatibacter mobilis]QJD74670.1 pyrroloquinoline quinone-dependent dehydrogenase [Pyruvatibacter mobilis]GGD09161.1 quinoprotein glucose dehydrogenase [Pyruvatibacter mobilis]